MDCIEGPQRWLGESPGAGEQGAVERPQRNRVEQFSGAPQEQVDGNAGSCAAARCTARGISASTSSLLRRSAPSRYARRAPDSASSRTSLTSAEASV